jgi:uncharacterized membrane protein YeaQ/YmgE (transglycosylase-associated protein family)
VIDLMWTLVGALVAGTIVGGLARLLLPGRQDMSAFATVAVGIVAALVGGGIAAVLGVADTPGIDWIELAIQVGLAMVGVGLWSGWFFTRNKPRS